MVAAGDPENPGLAVLTSMPLDHHTIIPTDHHDSLRMAIKQNLKVVNSHHSTA
jgi:hypothetical protein